MEGCESVLDLAPVSTVTEGNYWQNPEQFEIFMTGIHSRLRTHVWDLERMGEFRADIFGESPMGTGTIEYLRLHLNTLNSADPVISNFGGFYTNINQLNLFISKTQDSDLLSQKDKNYFLGQAYGLRAFYYFHLLRSWGDVVLVKDPIFSFEIDKLEKAASSASEVMELIKEDIENSVSSFTEDYSFKANDKLFWSKAATLMLKSEVYLWSSRQMGGGTADATIAKTALTEIQTKIPSLGLLPNFKDVFSYNNKGNKELIFAIRNKLNEYTLFNGNFNKFLPREWDVINYYDSVNNVKLDVSTHTILTVSSSMYVAIYKSIFRKFSDLDTRKLASINGAYSLTDGNYSLVDGLWVNKYQGVFNLGLREMVDDFPIYRYADLLLMLAEAKSILGEEPANEINLVRQRAYASNYQLAVHGYPNLPGDGDINETLLNERLFEFLAEGKRWYDLRRFGKNYVFKYTTAKQDYQLLWPIDNTTLTNNKALVQTSGY